MKIKGKISKKIFVWVVSILIFGLFYLGFTYLIGYFLFNKFILINPLKITSVIWKAFVKGNLKNPIYNITLVILYYIPLAMVLGIGFEKLRKTVSLKYKGDTKRNEKLRRGIKGTSKWITAGELKNRGYLFTRKEMSDGVVFGQSDDAIVYAPNTFTIKTKKKGKYIISAPIGKKVGSTPTVNHTLIIGATRSGKGISTIIPTLLSYSGSVIVYDPAVENFTLTGEWRKRYGKVLYFHPQDPNSTLHFNPLDLINKDEFQILMSINSICQILVQNTDPKAKFFDDSARDFVKLFIEYVLLFYPKDKQNLYSVSNLTNIMTTEREHSYSRLKDKVDFLEECLRNETDIIKKENIEKQLKVLCDEMQKEKERFDEKKRLIEDIKRKYNVEEEEAKKFAKDKNPDLFMGEGEGLFAFVDRLFLDIETEKRLLLKADENKWRFILLDNAFGTLQKLKTLGALKSEQTMGSIMQTVSTALQFYADENLAKLMDRTNFTVEDLTLKDEALSLYLNIPNELTTHFKTFMSLFVSLLSSALTSGDSSKERVIDYASYYKKNGKKTVLFLLDEFPQLGKIESVKMMIPFIGKFGVAFCLICQNVPQLESAYTKEGAKEMIDNMQVINVKKVGKNYETCDFVSKALGNSTVLLSGTNSSYGEGGKGTSVSVSLKEEQRPLMYPSEVSGMSDAEQILLIPGIDGGAKIKKIQWFTEEMFIERVNYKHDKEDTENIIVENKDELKYYEFSNVEHKEEKKEIEEKKEYIKETLKEEKINRYSDEDNLLDYLFTLPPPQGAVVYTPHDDDDDTDDDNDDNDIGGFDSDSANDDDSSIDDDSSTEDDNVALGYIIKKSEDDTPLSDDFSAFDGL